MQGTKHETTAFTFEEHLADLFQLRGYNTWVKPSGNDKSVSMLLERGRQKLVIRVVHHNAVTEPTYMNNLILAQQNGYVGPYFLVVSSKENEDNAIHHYSLHVVDKKLGKKGIKTVVDKLSNRQSRFQWWLSFTPVQQGVVMGLVVLVFLALIIGIWLIV